VSDEASPSDRLARLLDELAGSDVAAVLSEARADARERVRARLTEELTHRMLGLLADDPVTRCESAGRSEPPAVHDATAVGADARVAARPPAERPSEEAVYVYAVTDGAARPAIGAMRGIADAPVRVVTCQATGLQALVTDVPLEQFGDEALKRNLNDLSWLSAAALRHEATVEAAMVEATLVPLRMCTIFRDDDGVRDMLAREEPAFVAALARLQHAHEWGVKVIADPDAFAAAIAGEEEATLAARSAGEGAAYFATLRRDRTTREEVARELGQRARAIHDAVAALATEVRLHPGSNRELSGHEGEMVLNGAYLVSADRTDDLRRLTRSLDQRHRAHGLTVELTGPWPPYNFAMPAGGL